MTDSYTDLHKNMRHWLHELARFLGTPVYYDVGANRGMFVQHMVAVAGAIVAFEPVESTFRTLRDESSGDAILVKAGLGEARDEMVIHHYSDDTFNSLYDRADQDLEHYSLEKTGTERVAILSLDELLSGDRESLNAAGLTTPPPGPELMKIDIEGAELTALKGMERLLADAPPLILCEYSVDNTENAGYSRDEISRFLSRRGYTIYGLFRNEDLALHRDITPRSIWNIIAVPEQQHRRFTDVFAASLGDPV